MLLKKGEATLPKASVVNISQILTVDKAELVECTGRLSAVAASAVREIAFAVRQAVTHPRARFADSSSNGSVDRARL